MCRGAFCLQILTFFGVVGGRGFVRGRGHCSFAQVTLSAKVPTIPDKNEVKLHTLELAKPDWKNIPCDLNLLTMWVEL